MFKWIQRLLGTKKPQSLYPIVPHNDDPEDVFKFHDLRTGRLPFVSSSHGAQADPDTDDSSSGSDIRT